MSRARLFRLAILTLVPAAALTLILFSLARSPSNPAASSVATTAPSPAPTTPASPAPTIPFATQAPSIQAPATQAPATQAPATAPAQQKLQTADPFGEEFTLTSKTVVSLKGTADWDSAFDSLLESLKTLAMFLDKQGLKPAGSAMIVYTSTDDTGFTYQAEIPVDQEPKNLTKDITIGKSPDGKVLKFVHRGSYDNMDNTYEAITNHLDDKKLEAKDTFIEEYITDPLATPEDNLIINVFVPLK